MLKKIKFMGGFFSQETELELFANEDRLSFIYGKNGSGKSTISKAFCKAKGECVEDIIQSVLYDQDDKIYSDTQCIHVFNEEYVNSRVKIQKDGLNTIVLLGELGNLEDKIQDLELRLEAETERHNELKADAEEYYNMSSPKSPSYCKNQIYLGLSGDSNWAGREKVINDGKRNASVTEKTIDNIIMLSPRETLEVLKKRFEGNLALLKQVRDNEAIQIRSTTRIEVPYDEERLRKLLALKVERPVLSEREQFLLNLIEDGKMDQINDMKATFVKVKTKQCPFCLQQISEQGKHDLIESIEKVLSKEIDVHKEKLRECILQGVTVDFSGMDVLNSQNYIKCKDLIEEVNNEISKIRDEIIKKINHPYTPIVSFESSLLDKIDQYEYFRAKLQQEIDTYNDAVKRAGELKIKLSEDNAAIAHYEVTRDTLRWNQALVNQRKADDALAKSTGIISGFKDELGVLESKKKSIKIAVNLINKSLRYVFYSKDRLEIKVENNKYVLYSHGNAVSPENVSVGERNIIALCYFFTEIITNQEAKEGYAQKLTLVIDDPVSSYDFENKVGVMSLLKLKGSEIIKTNIESQILILTHDLRCVNDLQKIGKEICDEYKTEKNGKKVTFSCRELKNKEIIQLNLMNRNEYSELLKMVYDYACGENENELVIGNVMRRVMEVFSTFIYKKGISEVSCDDSILQPMANNNYKDYFKNLMYRLVLHGDSHMKERTESLEDTDYNAFLSDEARQRTARDVICFMYLLNRVHVMAHLKERGNANKNIEQWCSDIESFLK